MSTNHEKIMQIWEAYPQHRNDRMPGVVNDIKPNSIVYCGINPSFSITVFKNIFKGSRFAQIDPNSFFDYANRDMYNLNDAIEMEELSIVGHHYYAKMKDIGKELDSNMQIADLFYVRETNQKLLDKMIFKNSKHDLNDFGRAQFNLSIENIIKSKPKCVLFANALASHIVLNELDLEFNEEIGTYILEGIPVFLSSMLTGQRALDNHSYKRLVWQMKKAINAN